MRMRDRPRRARLGDDGAAPAAPVVTHPDLHIPPRAQVRLDAERRRAIAAFGREHQTRTASEAIRILLDIGLERAKDAPAAAMQAAIREGRAIGRAELLKAINAATAQVAGTFRVKRR